MNGKMPVHLIRVWCLSLCLWGFVLFPACSSNRCQTLCDAYYQMASRCDLFGVRSGQQPETCLRNDSDPQVIQQRNDYATQQCRLDFREVSCKELKDCCRAECFSALVTEYDAISGTQEQNYEQQREVCHKFQQLAETGSAPWCTSISQSCVESWCSTARTDCPDEALNEPLCAQ